VDVPGLSERPCRVAVLALAEGAASATVTLRNEATGEYLFWTLSVAAGAAPARCAAWRTRGWPVLRMQVRLPQSC
jgi:hypothetical protein